MAMISTDRWGSWQSETYELVLIKHSRRKVNNNIREEKYGHYMGVITKYYFIIRYSLGIWARYPIFGSRGHNLLMAAEFVQTFRQYLKEENWVGK